MSTQAYISLEELRALANKCMIGDDRSLQEFPSAVESYLNQAHNKLKQYEISRKRYESTWEEVKLLLDKILDNANEKANVN